MKLLMENWREYLEELENTSDVSIPKKFYISIYFDEKYRPDIMKNLGDNKVVKVPGDSSSDIVGFSDNPSNFMQMHGSIRDATIVMSGKDFAEINDSVVKIEYGNPNFFAQDGLKAFYRVTEKNQASKEHAQRVMDIIVTITDHDFQETMEKITREKASPFEVNAMRAFFTDWDTKEAMGNALYDNLENIWNVDTLYKTMVPVLEKLIASDRIDSWKREILEKYITPDFVRILMYLGLESAGKNYEEENEWVVDTNVMNVPASSIIYIAGPAVKTKKIFNKMKQGDLSKAERFGLRSEMDKMDKIMDAIEKYDLENKYKKVIITDMGTFNAAKNKWQKRKRELQYGVQEMPKAAE